MEIKNAVIALSALAHDTRIAIFRALVRAGLEGEAAGTLARSLNVAASTLSRHLALLEQAGLVAGRRQARHIFYSVDIAGMQRLFAFLIDDCCQGAPELCGFTETSVEERSHE